MQSLQELYKQREAINNQIQWLKSELSVVDKTILGATQGKVQQMFALAGKQSGTVRVLGEDGIAIVGEIPKKVEWDSKALMNLASTMTADQAFEIFDIKFSIPEKKFASLPEQVDSVALQAILSARTVKYGDMKISLEVKS
jgi:hypothetical protein